MRNVVTKLVIGMAITAIGMFGANSQIGTWKLNAAKSKSTASNPRKSQTDVREETPDGSVKTTRSGVFADGTAYNYSYTVKLDGKEYPVTGAEFDTIAIKRVDADTTTYEVRKTGGKYHATGKVTVSNGGKTLTQSSQGTDAAGKPFTATLVFDKQ